MGGYIYCLYSTEDGGPRYVGRASDKVSYRFKQHIAAALEKQPGALYDWMRDVWRRGFDVAVYTLQDEIIPKDFDMFEKYWIDQFSNLLNFIGNGGMTQDSPIGRQIKEAIQAHLRLLLNSIIASLTPSLANAQIPLAAFAALAFPSVRAKRLERGRHAAEEIGSWTTAAKARHIGLTVWMISTRIKKIGTLG